MADRDDDDFSFGEVGEEFSDSEKEGWGTLDDQVVSAEKPVGSSEKEPISPPETAQVSEQDVIEDASPGRLRGRLLLIGLLGLALGAVGYYYLSGSPPPVEKALPEAVNRQPIPIPARPPAFEEQSKQAPSPVPEAKEAAVSKGTLSEVRPEEVPGRKPMPQVTAEPFIMQELPAAEQHGAQAVPGPVAKDQTPLKEVAAVKPSPGVPAAPQVAVTGKYTVQVGVFVNRLNRDEAMETVRALGFTPVVTPVVKTMPMVRLLIGVFDPVEAKGRVKDLAEVAPDAFYLRRGDSYAVYAASFYEREKARVLEQALSEKGISVTEEPANIEITLSRLSFGEFSDRQAAELAISKARSVGLEAQVVATQ